MMAKCQIILKASQRVDFDLLAKKLKKKKSPWSQSAASSESGQASLCASHLSKSESRNFIIGLLVILIQCYFESLTWQVL